MKLNNNVLNVIFSKNFILALIILLAGLLRFYKLGQNPPSLYWDEVSLGYNAYSILKTAHDEHNKFLPLTNFGAFGDYKPPGYIYATVPSIALFDLTEFAVRFPSAFFGTITVIITFFLAQEIFKKNRISLLAAFFLAISPWHLQISRVAFEANLALFFSTLGILFFLKFKNGSKFSIFISLTAFLAAMYTFTGQRLFIPFIMLFLFYQSKNYLLKNWKYFLTATMAFGLLFLPLFLYVTKTTEGKQRFNEVTIFKDLKPINDSNKYRNEDNFSPFSSLIHNRRFFFLHDFSVHYFHAFNPSFLFFRGDQNPRLSIQNVGELYYFDIALLLLGTYMAIRFKKNVNLIFIWLLISPLGPATARETPHALRMAHILPTFQILSAAGFYQLIKLVKYRKLLAVVSLLVIFISMLNYLIFYYVNYPKEYSGEWQFGYKESIKFIKPLYGKFDKVQVSDYMGRAYVYYLFYLKYDPKTFQQNSKVTKDQFFFYNVDSFDKFNFTKNSLDNPSKVLYVESPGNLPKDAQLQKTIFNLSNKPVFEIGTQQ